jgi:hypothetical protein
LDRDAEFVSDFCETIVANDLADTFGLIVPKSVSKAEFEFVEFNEDRSSVLKETLIAENDPSSLFRLHGVLYQRKSPGNVKHRASLSVQFPVVAIRIATLRHTNQESPSDVGM